MIEAAQVTPAPGGCHGICFLPRSFSVAQSGGVKPRRGRPGYQSPRFIPLPEAFSTKQVVERYLALQKVERDFRTMKTGELELHPIFLRKAERTEGRAATPPCTLPYSASDTRQSISSN